MSIGFSASDFIALPQFAWTVYQGCRDSANDFTELASEVQSLHAVLSELAILLRETSLSDGSKVRLDTIQNGCRSVLQSVEHELSKYKSLGTNNKRVRDKMRWGMENIGHLRIRLVSHTTMLTLFIVTLHG